MAPLLEGLGAPWRKKSSLASASSAISLTLSRAVPLSRCSPRNSLFRLEKHSISRLFGSHGSPRPSPSAGVAPQSAVYNLGPLWETSVGTRAPEAPPRSNVDGSILVHRDRRGIEGMISELSAPVFCRGGSVKTAEKRAAGRGEQLVETRG